MSTVTSFEEMEVWQLGQKLLTEVKKICKNDLIRKDFDLVDQITRAARSIPTNIAEGFESNSNKDFAKFLGYSQRSVGEVRSLLYEIQNDKILPSEMTKSHILMSKNISKQLSGFIRYLYKNSNNKRNSGVWN